MGFVKIGIVFYANTWNKYIMAEYSRGQDNRDNERSGHNNGKENNSRGRMKEVNFNPMNFEQRRKPYGISGREEMDGYNKAGSPAPVHPRDDVWM